MKKKWLLILVGAALVLALIFFSGHSYTGTDDQIGQVTKKYTRQVGVKERPPLINTDRGDLLLFLFAGAGLVVGFYLGYQWRGWFGPELENEEGRSRHGL